MSEVRLLSDSTSFAATAETWAQGKGLLDEDGLVIGSFPAIIGVTDGAVNLGSFDIGIITAGRTIKQALQSLETAVDSRLIKSNNLSELTNKAAARASLELGTAATEATGTSGAVLPFLNGINSWSAKQTFAGKAAVAQDIEITANNGQEGSVKFLTSTTARWLITKSLTSETGSNVGSDFTIRRYNDAGSLLDVPFTISRATGALTLVQPLAAGSGGTGYTSLGDLKTGLAFTKADLSLGNVDNTSDANKPISTATQTALNAKQATLVSATNIKTINGTSLLGSGDIAISSGGGSVVSVAALTLGTTGTDLSSSVANWTTTPVITLNVPTASASNRGVVSAADWTTFNGKQAALGFTPLNPGTSQTANTFYAAPNGAGGAPTFRAIATADIPTLNQSTTGSAATLTTGRTIAMTGEVSWTSASFNGSTNVTGTSTIGANVVTFSKIQQVATSIFLGRTTAGTGDVESLSITTATSMLNAATTSVKGLMSSADKTKLDGVATGATANTGTVTSVDFSGGSTGLTVSGNPITNSGTITLAGTLAATNGGTGLTSYTAGSLIYASSTTALTTLAAAAAGNVLISGTNPSWGKVALSTHISGTLAVSNGGTGATTLTGYVIGNGASAFTTVSTLPIADLTGTLNVARGGTGATTVTGYLMGNGTAAVTGVLTIPFSDTTGTVPVNRGGSGATTLTGYLIGNGTGAFTASSTIAAADISGTIGFATRSSTLDIANSSTNASFRLLASSSTGNGQSVISTAGVYINPSASKFYAADFENTSDDRLKTRTGTIDHALEKITQLDTFKYTWNETAQEEMGVSDLSERIGISAQQVQELFPQLVGEFNGYLSVGTLGLVPVLIEAVKTLKAQVEALTAAQGN